MQPIWTLWFGQEKQDWIYLKLPSCVTRTVLRAQAQSLVVLRPAIDSTTFLDVSDVFYLLRARRLHLWPRWDSQLGHIESSFTTGGLAHLVVLRPRHIAQTIPERATGRRTVAGLVVETDIWGSRLHLWLRWCSECCHIESSFGTGRLAHLVVLHPRHIT